MFDRFSAKTRNKTETHWLRLERGGGWLADFENGSSLDMSSEKPFMEYSHTIFVASKNALPEFHSNC